MLMKTARGGNGRAEDKGRKREMLDKHDRTKREARLCSRLLSVGKSRKLIVRRAEKRSTLPATAGDRYLTGAQMDSHVCTRQERGEAGIYGSQFE